MRRFAVDSSDRVVRVVLPFSDGTAPVAISREEALGLVDELEAAFAFTEEERAQARARRARRT